MESIHFSMQEEQKVCPQGVIFACGLRGGKKQIGQTVSARTAATDTSLVMLEDCHGGVSERVKYILFS